MASLIHHPNAGQMRRRPQHYNEADEPIYVLAGDEEEESNVGLMDAWRIVCRYRWTIVLAVILSTALAYGASMLMTPVYRANVIAEALPSRGGIINFQNVNQQSESGDTRQHSETQRRIIKSGTLAESVASQLETLPALGGGVPPEAVPLTISAKRAAHALLSPLLNGKDEDGPELSAEDAAAMELAAATSEARSMSNFVRNGLEVQSVPKSYLLDISFESVDPEIAAIVANTIADAYIKFSDQKRFASTAGAKAYLENEIQRVQTKLEESELALTDFARNNELVDLEDRDNIVLSRLKALNDSHISARADRIAAEAALGEGVGRSRAAAAASRANNDSVVARLRIDYIDLQNEATRRAQLYQPRHPLVVEIQEQLAVAKTALDREVAKVANDLDVEIDQLRSKEVVLQEAVGDQKNELLDLQNRAIQYNILKREWETNKQLYSGLLERMKEVGVAAGMEINNIAIIEGAKVPKAPYKPDLPLNLLAGLAAGLILGIGLAFLRSFMDNTVRSTDDMERVTQLPSLGLLPLASDKALTKGNLALVSHNAPRHDLSEAYRSLSTSLMFATPNNRRPQTLLVTSAAPGEGKTSTAVNLAISLARNSVSVLLVDADLRRPDLHRIFGVPNSPGLAECLMDGQVDKIHETSVDNLWLLSAGKSEVNPAEMFSSAALERTLEAFSGTFQYVIIDTSPILGLADPVILGSKVDAVLTVVAAAQITKRPLMEAVKRMRRANAPMLGAVLNKADPDNLDYGFQQLDYYGYGRAG